MDCRIVVAQNNPRLGDLHANLEDHLKRIEAAAAAGADLIVFPELSLTGYFLKDQVFELGLGLESPEIARLAEASKKISILVGCVERTAEERFYNSCVFLENGAVLGVHRKVHLVSYGMFDEERDFAAGDRFRVIESRHGRFGPLLCEDFWHVPSSWLYFLDDADALLVPSASPARGVSGPEIGSRDTWDTLLKAGALFYRTWIVYAGRVGWEDGIGFGGGSCVFDPFGKRVAALDGFEPGELEAHLAPEPLRRARIETPLRRDARPWVLASELSRLLPAVDLDPKQEGQDG